MPPKKTELGTRLRKASRAELTQRDVFGRALIHVVCLVGRPDLLSMLLSNPLCQPSLQDYESGWTCLHYAIFYGRLSCARLLIEYDYSLMKVKDRNGLTAMDLYHLTYAFTNLRIFPQSIGKSDTNYIQRVEPPHLKKDEDSASDTARAPTLPTSPPTHRALLEDPLIWFDKDNRGGSELYTFGSNVNYQLATGDSDDRTRPFNVLVESRRPLDDTLSIADRLVKPRIKDIKLSKNHSVLLTNERVDNVLVAGNASRGRLGNGSSVPNYKFKGIKGLSHLHILEAAVSDDHTLALTADGEVYSWGLNNFLQLGYQTERVKEKTDTFSDEPKRVVNGLKKIRIKGISCSKIHSCAFFDSSLVIWGLNVGQMDFVSAGELIKYGKLKGIVQIPRKIDFSSPIKQAIATDEATTVLLANNECHILTNGNHLRFSIPLYRTLNNEFEYFRPATFSKKRSIIKLVSKDAAKIGILYDDGSVSNFGVDMFSKSSNIKFTTIWNPRNDHLKCIDVDIGKDGSVVIVTKSGCVYKRVTRWNGSDFKFSKIDRISNVVKASCDSLFSSFGFIKDDVDQLPLQLMKNRFHLDIAYLSPLSQSVQGRKQAELVNLDSYKPYDIDFLHKPHFETQDDETYKIFQRKFTLEESEEFSKVKDPLLNHYQTRWSRPQNMKDTFEHYVTPDVVMNILTSADPIEILGTLDTSSNKGYDLYFDVQGKKVGVHKCMLFLVEKMETLEHEDVNIGDVCFVRIDNGVVVTQNLHPVSLLIMIHMIYTNNFVKPWDLVEDASTLQDVEVQTVMLLKKLGLVDDLQRPDFNTSIAFHDFKNFDTDVIIQLQDGDELRCWSQLLKARNAYFETLFSERWDEDDVSVLDFTHVRKDVFEIALKYIYGQEQLSLLDDHHELGTVSEFINFSFELIELSDELMLFGLKDFCQLMIKDFITSENILLILHHSDVLDCQKLIGECLWFIYNNVDTLLVDPNYELLSNSVVKRIDKYCRWLKRVNKTNPNDNRESWYDGDSSKLLTEFLNERRVFNDIFLESDDFVPLFDLALKKEPKSPKLEAKKVKASSPQPSVPSSMGNKRPSSTAAQAPRKPSFASMSRKASVTDSSAVEFADDEEFQPVINRRRRSSATNRPGSSTFQTSTVMTPSISKNNPLRRDSNSSMTPSKNIAVPHARQFRKSSMSSAVVDWPEFGSPGSALSPMSTWASPSTVPTPVLGSSPSSKPFVVSSSPSAGSSKVVNIGPPRMSQKERKRLMKSEVSVEQQSPASSSGTPWKIPSGNNSISSFHSPSLLSAQEEAMAELGALQAIPSLRGIIHEEEHKLLEEKNVNSLAEVQQEEEFAKWWEEESRRVQQQLTGSSNEMGTRKTSVGGAQKKRGGQKKRSDRAYRKQSIP